MQRNKELKNKRTALIHLAINNPVKGAEYLKQIAFSLECCKNTVQVVDVLKEVLFLSERTIYGDLTEKTDIELIKD